MTNSVKNNRCERENHFSTIRENRKLRLIEPDYNVGLRNFRYAENTNQKNKPTPAEVFVRVFPWAIAGLTVVLAILL
ncbi:MAG: hypothetical protein IPO92_13180 [Saprospiraceae bacterium]|nr:hypothetical protein [Saprospiraceae bacterium]